nr:M15 family metallopeptidase [uncultured Cohaesibacter sp.]
MKPFMRKDCFAFSVLALCLTKGLLWGTPALAAECAKPVDFLNLPLARSGNPIHDALTQSYPGLTIKAGKIHLATGQVVPLEGPRSVSKPERLEDATIGDMFVYLYPLDFSLKQRKVAFHDPGRVRNEAFFRALMFDSKAGARKSLTTVRYRGAKVTASFSVTTKHCVHTQLQAALSEIAAHKPSRDKFFRKIGGSFNWRKISGTNRLSSHSFGSAVDVNSQLGKYWKWLGVKPGKAVRYDNAIPQDIVEAFEKRGFIWGGKWHHFDGMHFEYRPELILYARLMGQ